MAQSRGKPAAEVEFSDFDQAQTWFQSQPREVRIAVAVRAALRVLPFIEAVDGDANFAPRVALLTFRACFVAWAISKFPFRRDRLRGAIPPAVADSSSNAAAYAADAAINGDPYAAADASAAASFADYRVAYAVQADAVAIEQGRAAVEIVADPLWPSEMPERIAEAWDELRTWMLIDEANTWDPWCSGTSACATGARRLAKRSTSPSPR